MEQLAYWRTFRPKKSPIRVLHQLPQLRRGSGQSIHSTSSISLESQQSASSTADREVEMRRRQSEKRANNRHASKTFYSNKLAFPNVKHVPVFRNGRRYMDRLPYPLPSDLKEFQRQNLLTNINVQVFGAPIMSPIDPHELPHKVLDLCCGDGYWSSICHEYFASFGHPLAHFTGLDVGEFAPDLRETGVDWTFVQHDIRNLPLPFADCSFDFINFSNCSLALDDDLHYWGKLNSEFQRLLEPGAVIQSWEMDYQVRRLLPIAAATKSPNPGDALLAKSNGVYMTNSRNDFTTCDNAYLEELNKWLFLFMRSMSTPYAPMTNLHTIKQTPGFEEASMKMVAIPLGRQLVWDDPVVGSGKSIDAYLDEQQQLNQIALREAAFQVLLGLVEGLELQLRQFCGKSDQEWSRWWNSMVASVLEPSGCSTGECLVVGAWWCRKPANDNIALPEYVVWK